MLCYSTHSTVQCSTIHTIQYTQYSAPSTVHPVQYSQYSTPSKVHTEQSTQYSAHSIVHTAKFTLFNATVQLYNWEENDAQMAIYSTHCTNKLYFRFVLFQEGRTTSPSLAGPVSAQKFLEVPETVHPYVPSSRELLLPLHTKTEVQ